MTAHLPENMTVGLNDFLGFQPVKRCPGHATLEADLDERHKNRQSRLHGDVTATLIDAVTGYCGVYEPDPTKRRGNVTVSLSINFVGHFKGQRLRAVAEFDRAGRRLCFASTRVTDDCETLVATTEAVYAYVERQLQMPTASF